MNTPENNNTSSLCILCTIMPQIVPLFALTLGAGTGKNVENHVRENVRWILFKTHNCYIFLRYTIASSKCELRIIYNIKFGLSCGILLFRCKVT